MNFQTILNFIAEYWYLIGPAALEIALRLWPTEKEYSIIKLVYEILNKLIPHIKKKTLLLGFLLVSCAAFGQLNTTYKGAASINTDSATVKAWINSVQASYGDVGGMYYNKQSSKWRVFTDSTWVDLFGDSGGPVDTTYLPWVYPEYYGAVGDGTTNDQAAIQTAVNTGRPVWFSKKNYRVNSTVNIPTNSMLYGSGTGSIISTTSNISILTVTGNYSVIENLTFDGNDAGAAQTGINIVGNAGLTLYRISNRIVNCTFTDFDNAGVYVQNMVGEPSTTHQGAVYIVNSVAYSCEGQGFWFDDRAEYNMMANCKAYNCLVGIRIDGGNNNVVGSSFTDCTSGVSIQTGTNDGHGSMTGCTINHNTTNIRAENVTKNFIFAQCDLYAGNILLNVASGIRFYNCEIDGSLTINSTNSTLCSFTNCFFEGTPTLSVTGTAPQFFNNIYRTGAPTGTPDNLITGKFTGSPTATIAGQNFGTLAGDPSTLVNGDVWYNSSTGKLRGREGGASFDLVNSGITNTAANTEIPQSNGTNLIPSGVFNPTAGNVTLGSGSIAGSRTIGVASSTADAGITFAGQGTGSQFNFNSGATSVAQIDVGGADFLGNLIVQSPSFSTPTEGFLFSSTNHSLDFGLGTSTTNEYSIAGNGGTTGSNDGRRLTIRGGNGFPSSGNGSGGGLYLTPGAKRAAGSGTDGNVIIDTFNNTGQLQINDGANETMGVATLVGGTVTVNNTKVTTNSRIFLTHQNNSGTVGFVTVSARVNGTSFTITSSSGIDTSQIAWLIIEPF